MTILPVLGLVIVFHNSSWVLARLATVLPSSLIQASEQEVEEQIRHTFFVTPDANGNISGAVKNLRKFTQSNAESPLKMSLLHNGIEEYQTETQGGLFTFEDVEPGKTYTLLATGRDGFLAYAVRVVERTFRDKFNLKENDRQIESAAIPPPFDQLEEIIGGSLPDGAFFNDARLEDGDLGKELVFRGGFVFSLNEDGAFSGRLLVPPKINEDNQPVEFAPSDMNVYLIQDDKEIGSSTVDADGKFEITGGSKKIKEGIYGFVAAGKQGFAAAAVNLIGKDENAFYQYGARDHYYVSTAQEELPVFQIVLVTNPEDIRFISNKVSDINLRQNRIVQNPNVGTVLGGIPSGLPGGIPSGFPGGIPSGFPGGIPSGLPSGLPSGITSGFPAGATPGFPATLTAPQPGGLLARIPSPNLGRIRSLLLPALIPAIVLPLAIDPAPASPSEP